MKKPTAIICDIDGTLAKRGDRSPYNWAKVGKDTLHQHIADMLDLYAEAGAEIILVSGRDSICKNETLAWLDKYEIVYSALYMRPMFDKRRDTEVKHEIYEKYIRGKYNIEFVLDDRDQVVKMWRSLGIPCLQVAEGKF